MKLSKSIDVTIESLAAGYTTHPGAMSPDMVWWAAANMSEVELIDINRQEHALANH